MKKIIGINALTYPEIRNFAGHIFNNYEFKKLLDFYKFPAYFLFKIRKKINRKWQNTFNDFHLNYCNFYHFFNVINAGSKPYIVTYETALPRWRDTDKDFEKGLKLLAKNNCKKIIALSECASKRQANITKKYSPAFYDIIMKKNMVLLPPQPTFINTIDEKRKPSDKIIFTIVGADFFRKGGQAILNVFEELLHENKNIQLNIVSNLNYGDYASKTTILDYKNALITIAKYPNHIQLFKHLKNEDVQQLLLNTDVALLPSIAETFGYFILEAQAAACPVITTDIRAMPEINNNERGWLIRIANAGSDDASIDQPTLLIRSISDQMKSIIDSILLNPEIIRLKGQLALENIQQNHSPILHKETLLELYDSI